MIEIGHVIDDCMLMPNGFKIEMSEAAFSVRYVENKSFDIPATIFLAKILEVFFSRLFLIIGSIKRRRGHTLIRELDMHEY